jgi:hypothetical protein
MPRPQQDEPGGTHFRAATPMSATMITLTGGQSFEGVTFTNDQMRRMLHIYGYDPDRTEREVEETIARQKETLREWEEEQEALDPYDRKEFGKPKVSSPDGLRRLLLAGGEVGVFRQAKSDGLRMMAVLSRYLEPDEDPVKLLLNLLGGAGYDVGDLEWANDEDEGDMNDDEDDDNDSG